jgi:hypothetical protein
MRAPAGRKHIVTPRGSRRRNPEHELRSEGRPGAAQSLRTSPVQRRRRRVRRHVHGIDARANRGRLRELHQSPGRCHSPLLAVPGSRSDALHAGPAQDALVHLRHPGDVGFDVTEQLLHIRVDAYDHYGQLVVSVSQKYSPPPRRRLGASGWPGDDSILGRVSDGLFVRRQALPHDLLRLGSVVGRARLPAAVLQPRLGGSLAPRPKDNIRSVRSTTARPREKGPRTSSCTTTGTPCPARRSRDCGGSAP